jgi:hypothetical protein
MEDAMKSARIEQYRAELQRQHYTPLRRNDLAKLQKLYRSQHYRELTGIDSWPEVIEMLDMFIEERVPPDVSERFILRYVNEELVAGHQRSRPPNIR